MEKKGKGAFILARYTTLLFDADDTLLDFRRSEHEAILDAIGYMGIAPSEEMARVYSEINHAAWKRLERGEITKAELRTLRFSELCAYYGLSLDAEKFADAYISFLSKKSYLMEGALDVCRALAPHCRMYIITNGMAIVQEGRFDPSPLRPFFADVFISEKVGAEKPSPAFFDVVAARIPDFDARDTLVIGDSLTSDIKGGILAGIDTCWFNPKGAQAPADMPITYTVGALKDVVPLVLGA